MKLVDTVISPKQTYSLEQIARLKFIPWAHNQRTIKALIESDVISYAVVWNSGNGIRYSVHGKDLIKYLKKYGPYLMATVRKPRTYGKRTNVKRSSPTKKGRGNSRRKH